MFIKGKCKTSLDSNSIVSQIIIPALALTMIGVIVAIIGQLFIQYGDFSTDIRIVLELTIIGYGAFAVAFGGRGPAVLYTFYANMVTWTIMGGWAYVDTLLGEKEEGDIFQLAFVLPFINLSPALLCMLIFFIINAFNTPNALLLSPTILLIVGCIWLWCYYKYAKTWVRKNE